MNAIVIAKAPSPGCVKTRLCPPCTPVEAAEIAESALADTLDAVATAPFEGRVLALDGEPGAWLPAGFTVVPQRGIGLDERLAAAFDDVGGPALLVGMDTPQLTSADLVSAASMLLRGGVDAALGAASDGGWWAIALRRSDPDVFVGVPMSTARTGAEQLARLRARGLSVVSLPTFRDVDTFDDALAVSASAPGGRFGRAVRRIARRTTADVLAAPPPVEAPA
jgi:rSAM/selenodomain-associated transferase 1